MKKNQQKRIEKLMGIGFAIFAVLIIVLITVSLKTGVTNLDYIYNSKLPLEAKVEIKNVDVIAGEYQGSNDFLVIYKALDVFVNKTIPKYYSATNKMNDEELTKYFDKHKETIIVELGLSDTHDFIDFANSLKKFEDNSFNLKEYYFVPGTAKQNFKDLKISIKVVYDNGTIPFNIKIMNISEKPEAPVSFYVCKNQDVIDYEYTEKVLYPDVETNNGVGKVY